MLLLGRHAFALPILVLKVQSILLLGINLSTVFGQGFNDVAILLSHPVTIEGQTETITVYKNENQSVQFYKAEYTTSGGQRLKFYEPVPGNASVVSTTDDSTSLTLPGSDGIGVVSGIYTVRVDDTSQGTTQEIRVIIQKHGARYRPASAHFTVEDNRYLSKSLLGVEPENGALRWRLDGVFYSATFTDAQTALASKTSGVFEAFAAGDYKNYNHAVINVIVRDCPFTSWGVGCVKDCPKCFNGGVCSDQTGLCQCPPGFSGQHCEQVHGRNVFGQHGEYQCNENEHDSSCRGSQICYPRPFGCVCPAGYTGLDCTQECQDRKFGSNCQQDCHCQDSVECAGDTGICENDDCAEGWKGVNCQVKDPCPPLFYGDLCLSPCSCTSDNCSEVEQGCSEGCVEPWTGAACNENSTFGPPSYTRVNPGVTTTITCTSVSNPIPLAGNLLLVLNSTSQWSSSSSNRDERGYRLTNVWTLSLGGDTEARCYLNGEGYSQQVTLRPYELPRYSEREVLTFMDVTSTSITLSWPPWQDDIDVGDGPIAGYYIYYDRDGANSRHTPLQNETSVQLNDLTPDRNYRFCIVVAREGEGGTDYRCWAYQRNRTLCGVPAAASIGVTSTPRPTTSARFPITLPQASEIHCGDYNITLERRQEQSPWEFQRTLNQNWWYFVAPNLIPCVTYSFRIKIATAGGSVYSNVENVTMESQGLPEVRNLTVIPGLEDGSLSVSWDRPDVSQNGCPLLHYRVQAYFLRYEPSCSSSQDSPQTVSTTTTTTSHTFTDLKPSAQYAIYVGAQGLEDGDASQEYGSTDTAAPDAPPGNVGTVRIASRAIEFQWDLVACEHRNGPITSYRYIFSGNSNTTQGFVTRRYKEFSGLVPYTEYAFQVAAGTDAGIGPYKDEIVVTTNEAAPPRMMAPVSPFANISVILVRWEPPNPPHGIITVYRLQYRIVGGEPTNVDLPDGSLGEYLLTGLESSSNYTIRIRAYTRAGSGLWSPYLTRITEEGIPGPPDGLQVIGRTMTEITVFWSIPVKPQGKITQYRVSYRAIFRPYDPERQLESFESVIITDVGMPNITYSLTNLDPSTEYTIAVFAATSAGEGESLTINGTTEPFTDLEAPDISQIAPTRSGNVVVIQLPPLTQQFATGYRIRMRSQASETSQESRRRRDLSKIKSHKDNPNDYITAELDRSDLPEDFNIGDNKTYGGYQNAPLAEGVDYSLSLITISKIHNQTSFKESEKVRIESVDDGGGGGGGGGGATAWIIIIILLIVIAAGVVTGLLVYRRRENEKQKALLSPNYSDSLSSRPKDSIRTDLEMSPKPSDSLDNLANTGVANPRPVQPVNKKSVKKLQKGIKTVDLAMYVKRKRSSEKDTLADEYEMLPDGQLSSWNVAAKAENKTKNRYGNIIPYDDWRVVLGEVEGQPHSDYVNASYIDGYKATNKYIASHGPNKASVLDFWRMVWQEECSKIVMLTNLQEGGKKKCEKYWPDETMKYGDLVVTLKETAVYSTCTMTTFTLSHATEGKMRDIRHYHFTAWPDMKVPDFAGPILDFIQLVREEKSYDTGPLLVHCSAGVGRTGTYITLDAMLDMALAEGKVNVYQFVWDLRQRRIKMVQVVEQYHFIYDALVEYFIVGNTSISAEDFRTELTKLKTTDHSPGVSLLQQQYKTLDLLTIMPPAQKFSGGNKPENINKNRVQSILPVDTFRPYLMTAVGEQSSNFINATFLSGYQRKNMFLGTQMPLECTIVDFWRMIWDYNSPIIVMLNEFDVQTMSPYLPHSKPVTFGPFTIEEQSSEHQQTIACRQLLITNTAQTFNGPRTITHIQVLDWPEDTVIPASPNGLLQAVNTVTQSLGSSDSEPVTVHCMDGVGRTGVFCALLSAIDQLKQEKKTDVFQLVNKLRTSQPQMLNKFDYYKLIFDSISLHLQDENIYENFSHSA